jgi:GntR family transcriptional regulator/MocR family aminotransferase
VSGVAAGLRVTAALPERYGPQERFLVDVAAAGVTVRPLSDCAHTPDEADGKGEVRLVLGYAHLSPSRIRDGVRRMAAAIT